MKDKVSPGVPAIDRRRFLAAASLAGVSLAVPAALSAERAASPSAAPLPNRFRPAPFDFEEVTIAELQAGMESRRWTARHITEKYLARIEEIDKSGPELNAILELNPDALSIAEALDAERKAKGARGPLHGIPVIVKDNIATHDAMHTSAGSLALAKSIAPRDAGVIERLRAAGCVILGKSNLSEWANARGRDAIGGWSGRGRLTKNPYVLDRSASGSSSGTAAAVAASLCAAGVGTETLGSIVSPSSVCGLVGIKPTVGLVSRSGIIPVARSQDTAGPMARNVRDAAVLLSAMAGADPSDSATAASAGKIARDYTTFLDAKGLQGARIGVARSLFGATQAVDRCINRALDVINDAGAVILDQIDVATANAVWDFEVEVLAYELKAGINEYLASLGPSAPCKTLKDLIRFNEEHRDLELEWFGQESFQYADTKGPLSTKEYLDALAQCRLLTRDMGIDATLKQHKLDAIVAPTQSPAWLADLVCGDNSTHSAYVTSAIAGYPSITVPAGDVAGLPVGMLFMGPAWSEGQLIRYAFAFECAVNARRAPLFLKTLELHA